ncbi:MurR/RpiR family transcriptional regulator [Yaniella flava]|uniref:MurR/RpiR family transcriptional regulator n=1 Tax=Yaniella flava TaxID=287930 RepID=UPI0031CE6D23
MSWQQTSDTPPSARMASLAPSLQPNQRRVIEAIMADRAATVEYTAQVLAEQVGVGRTTVIRTAQSLGYDGFPQLRVALVQELALEQNASPPADHATSSKLGELRAGVTNFGVGLAGATSALTEEALRECIRLFDEADRVLVIAHGLSSPLGLDLVQRLNSMGRSAEIQYDTVSEQIIAHQLGPKSVCFGYSGSGANKATLDAMRAAKLGGANVVAMTSFAGSALAEIADVTLVVPPTSDSFQDELIRTSRATLMLITEQLVDILIAYRGANGREALLTSLSMLGDALQE